MTWRFITKQSWALVNEKVKSPHDHRHQSNSCARGSYGTTMLQKAHGSPCESVHTTQASVESLNFLSQQPLAGCLSSIGLVDKTWYYCSVAETVSLFIILTQKSLMKVSLFIELSWPLPRQGRSYKKG